MTQVVLIRPGATIYDDQHRIQGVLDIPLSPRGLAEIDELSERMAGMKLSALYCAPCESAQRTAEALGRVLGLRPRRLEDLRNLDIGLWQGLMIDEIRRRSPKVYRQWLDSPATVVPPQGEAFDKAEDRVRSVLNPLVRRHREETIGVIAPSPLACMIEAMLRSENPTHFEVEHQTGCFEIITVAGEREGPLNAPGIPSK